MDQRICRPRARDPLRRAEPGLGPAMPRHQAGFTLIEVLVVISIISLLISILVPSLRKARESAKKTQCLSNLHAIFLANAMYVGDQGRLPYLNNLPNEGTWQYNYIIWDGEDFDQCFGPLARPGGIVHYIRQFYCPLQQDRHHMLSTELNPWPVEPVLHTRAGYGRRHGLSGHSFSEIRRTIAFAADVLHLPSLVRSAHKTGVNVVYADGHAQWVRDRGILTQNNLGNPFDIADNLIMDEIWKTLDNSQ